MKKWQQWVFINVMYYSTAFFFLKKKTKNKCYFQRTCLTFCLLCCTYILPEWSCRANKAAYFYFILFFTQFTPAVQEQCLSSLPFWQPVPLNNKKKKKTFSKYSTPLQLVDLFKWMDLDFKVKAAPVWRHPHTNTYAHRLGCYLRCDSDVKSIANVQFFLWPRNLQSLTRRLCHCFVSRKPILILRKYRRLVADFRTTRKTPTRRL